MTPRCADCKHAVTPTAPALSGYRQCQADTRPFAMATYVPAKWTCQFEPSRFEKRPS